MKNDMTTKQVMVLLSGGLDSTTLLYEIHRHVERVIAVSFDYGSKHNAKELPQAAAQCNNLGIEHIIIPLPFMNDHFASDLLRSGGEIPEGHYQKETMKQTVVPFRNGIMLSIAAGLAASRSCDSLAIAAHAGDHAIYPDCREPFMLQMAGAIKSGTYAGIELLRPFIDYSKTDIVRLGAELGVDYANTWSCYKGNEIHCGKCGTCVERREAFQLAGVDDPTKYESTPPISKAPGKN